MTSSSTTTAKDIAAVAAYHAHVYYDTATTRGVAERVRAGLEAQFPTARLGRWHDMPVGPHPRAMFQVALGPVLFPTLVPWLMLNREGLAVLVHPETGDPRADHLVHAAWLGEVLPLDASVLPSRAAE